LKKRTKKLLSVSGGTELSHLASVQLAICKSFSLLFFKKEALPFLLLVPRPGLLHVLQTGTPVLPALIWRNPARMPPVSA
jgi:hypothetical protein